MDFTAVAHDLRTPLNAMLGHMRLLAIEGLSDSGRRRLDIIEAQIHRMATLIDSYMPSPAAGPHIGQVDLTSEIHAVVAELDPLLQQRQIQVLLGGTGSLPTVAGDTDALHRVIVNLLVNAADSMPEGGRILINTGSTQLSVASVTAVTIDITDNGSGIPSDVLSHVFERGFTTKQPGEGTGLGLSICREIVQQHGGRIEVSTMPGTGTTVRLCFPTCGAVRCDSANSGSGSDMAAASCKLSNVTRADS